jgi:hypothetical protein
MGDVNYKLIALLRLNMRNTRFIKHPYASKRVYNEFRSFADGLKAEGDHGDVIARRRRVHQKGAESVGSPPYHDDVDSLQAADRRRRSAPRTTRRSRK